MVFEASLAEFVDLNRAFAAGKASPAYVADAIGGLWSVAEESDPPDLGVVFDGLLVLREEHPLKVVHDPKPRRASPTAQ